jgi:putative solute:sodium symporter small subunit
MGKNESMKEAPPNDYWRRTRRLTVWLLLAWGVVAFVPVFFARELSIEVFGWPLAFWLASQGALLGFCAIVVIYARAMARLDAEVGDVSEPRP